jgi:hypothetical protein
MRAMLSLLVSTVTYRYSGTNSMVVLLLLTLTSLRQRFLVQTVQQRSLVRLTQQHQVF